LSLSGSTTIQLSPSHPMSVKSVLMLPPIYASVLNGACNTRTDRVLTTYAYVLEAPNINIYSSPATLLGCVVFFISYRRLKGRYLRHDRFIEASTNYEGLTVLRIRENLIYPKLLISLRIAIFVKLHGYKFRKLQLFLNRLFRNFLFKKALFSLSFQINKISCQYRKNAEL
jgi:hypothetical protein